MSRKLGTQARISLWARCQGAMGHHVKDEVKGAG